MQFLPLLLAPSHCVENVSIPVGVTEAVVQLPLPFNYSTFNPQQIDNYPKVKVSGRYHLAARYCEPAVPVPSRSETLQILIHGVRSYTRNYWSGLAPPGQSLNGSEYSWIDYASNEGYPTLSIDRLCNGASSKPPGLVQCQLGFQAGTIREVVRAARAGRIGGRAFSRVILVGHSAGSLISNILSRLYSTEADALVLSGYTPYLYVGNPNPTRSAHMKKRTQTTADSGGQPDQSYIGLNADNFTAFEDDFYYGAFSHEVSHFDFNHSGLAPLGELATLFLGEHPAPQFKGDVFALSGSNDAPFCGGTNDASDCGCGSTSASAAVSSFYPNARSFGYYQPVDTGHCLNLHETARDSFKAAHDFLERQKY